MVVSGCSYAPAHSRCTRFASLISFALAFRGFGSRKVDAGDFFREGGVGWCAGATVEILLCTRAGALGSMCPFALEGRVSLMSWGVAVRANAVHLGQGCCVTGLLGHFSPILGGVGRNP